MRMVAMELSGNASKRVEDKPKFLFVSFNPWLYQGFEDARTALLQIVGDAVLAEAKNRKGTLDKAESLFKRINLLRLARIGGEVAATVLTGIPIGAVGKTIEAGIEAFRNESVKEGVEAAKQVPEATKGLLDEAKPVSMPNEIHEFRITLEAILEEMDVSMVVFVDDLDRCLPTTTISTLEAIRLLLFLPRCAFVVAADDAFIRGAVKVHFAGTDLGDELATNYFDKLIQVPLRVPRLGPNETKAYIAMLFIENARRERRLNESQFNDARSSVEKRLRETWKGLSVDLLFLESLVPATDTELVGQMGLAERLAPLLLNASAIQANPRLIKRFLNTVFLRKRMAKPQGIETDIGSLAKWHLLERCDENLAGAIASQVSSANEGKVHALRDAETAAKVSEELPELFAKSKFAPEWLGLPPALGESDLRPLLHLSRDGSAPDFGSDDLNSEGKTLLKALAAAKASSESLVKQIRSVGDVQAGLAMARAWEAKRASLTWQKADELTVLVEVCKVFPAVGARAAALVAEVPADRLTPAIAHALLDQPWATELLKKWSVDSATPTHVKKAIAQGRV
jgi:predicted KAP-like P-loop ATPase